MYNITMYNSTYFAKVKKCGVLGYYNITMYSGAIILLYPGACTVRGYGTWFVSMCYESTVYIYTLLKVFTQLHKHTSWYYTKMIFSKSHSSFGVLAFAVHMLIAHACALTGCTSNNPVGIVVHY